MKNPSKPALLSVPNHDKPKQEPANGRLVATISPEVEEFYTKVFPKTLRSTVVNQISIAFMQYCEKSFGGIVQPLTQSDTFLLLANYLQHTSSLPTYSKYRK